MHHATYLEAQVQTASPHRLHLLVVEAALRHARGGLEAIDQQRWDVMFVSLSKARDCVSELLSGLRPDVAPDVAGPTRDLFAFVYRNLALADYERSAQRVHDAIAILSRHRDTWNELGQMLAATATKESAEHIARPYTAGQLSLIG